MIFKLFFIAFFRNGRSIEPLERLLNDVNAKGSSIPKSLYIFSDSVIEVK